MTADEISASINERGFALVRGAIPADRMKRYLSALDAIYAEQADDATGDVEIDPFRQRSGLEITDLFDAPALKAGARLILGHNETLNGTFMSVGKEKAIPGLSLHTDGIIQGTDRLTLTMWAPLHPCGVDAPGLTVIPAAHGAVIDYLRGKFPGKKIPGWCSTAEWNSTGAFDVGAIRRTFGVPVSPVMEPGDVMLFTNWTIHGSNVTRAMTKRRSAAILRLRGVSLLERVERHARRLVRAALSVGRALRRAA